MEQIILPSKPAEIKPEDLVIPVVKNATFVYKKDTKMFCVLIPADKMDAFTACCFLDSVKLNYLMVIKNLMAEMAEQNSKIYKPGLMQGMKNFIQKKG